VRQASQLQEKHAGREAGQLHPSHQAHPFAASSVIFAFITATATNEAKIGTTQTATIVQAH
jgi:hypothetical protein